jgi:hypothetical protein
MQPPLNQLSLESRHLLFVLSLIGLFIFGWRMNRAQKGSPPGLPRVSQKELEFAASPSVVDDLKLVWKEEGTARVRRAILLDFGFLLFYGLLLPLACTFAAQGLFRHGPAHELGFLLAWGSVLAAVADVGANLAMLRMLKQESVSSPTLATAKIFASIQFLLIGLALIYVIAAILLSLLGQGATNVISGK